MEKRKSKQTLGGLTDILLEPVSFSGTESPESTLKTAQPDGKHLVKKPVAKNNFAVGLRISESKSNL